MTTSTGFDLRCKYETAIRNIAQLRILGENEYYEYIKSDAWLWYGGLIDFASGLSDVKNAVEKNMADVKSGTDAMRINLSSNLMYSVE